MKHVSETKKVETTRTSLGLREMLFQELDRLRNGETNPVRANVIAKTASQIISTVRLELDFHKIASSTGQTLPETSKLIGSINLG